MSKINVFQFLGLPEDYRKPNKVVQLVKHWKEVPESRKAYPYLGQVKEDGVFGMVVVHNGKAAIFGRTGACLQSCATYLFRYECNDWYDGVYIGEVLSHHPCSLEELSGVLNPERVNPLDVEQVQIADALYLSFHDYMPVKAFILGKTVADYQTRHLHLTAHLSLTPAQSDILGYTLILDEEAKDAFTEACLSAKKEGAVYKHISEGWEAGHKGYKAMKEVGEVSYDLLCIGFEEGKGKYFGKVANLLFRWKGGDSIKAMLGKGYTHSNAEQMLREIKLADEFGKPNYSGSPIGKVFKVKGLMDSSKGKLRLPKVAECRVDKTEGDF